MMWTWTYETEYHREKCLPLHSGKGTHKYLGVAKKLTALSFHFKFLLYTPNISLRTQDTQETLSATSKGEVKNNSVTDISPKPAQTELFTHC